MSGLVHIRRAGGTEFQILGAATLKLRVPNEVRTNGTESRSDNLRERVGEHAMESAASVVGFLEVNAV